MTNKRGPPEVDRALRLAQDRTGMVNTLLGLHSRVAPNLCQEPLSLSGEASVAKHLFDEELSGGKAFSRNAKRKSKKITIPLLSKSSRLYSERANDQAGRCYAELHVAFAFYGPRPEARHLRAIYAEEHRGCGPYREDQALGA